MLKHGGLLVLDAPNIALIGGDDILEEWFIDKHLYHFSRNHAGADDRGGGLHHPRTSPIRPIASISVRRAQDQDGAATDDRRRSRRSGALPQP